MTIAIDAQLLAPTPRHSTDKRKLFVITYPETLLLPVHLSLPLLQISVCGGGGGWRIVTGGGVRRRTIFTCAQLFCTVCSHHTAFLAGFPGIQEALSCPELLASTVPSTANALPSDFAQKLRLLQVSTQMSLPSIPPLPGSDVSHHNIHRLFVMQFFSFFLHVSLSCLSTSPLGSRLVCFRHHCRLL